MKILWMLVGVAVVCGVAGAKAQTGGMKSAYTEEYDRLQARRATTKAQNPAEIKPYPVEVTTEYMKSCAEDPKMTDYCQCTIDKLQAGMTLGQFIDVTMQGEKALLQNTVFKNAIADCLYKIPEDSK